MDQFSPPVPNDEILLLAGVSVVSFYRAHNKDIIKSRGNA